MAAFKSSLVVVLALTCASAAIAAPTPRENVPPNGTPKSDVQLDRAALFRPTQVGECAAVARRPVAERLPARSDSLQARRPARKTLASAGCRVVWSD